MGHCMTNGAVWHQHDNRSSLFKQHKGKLQEGIGALIKMSSQSGYLVEQSELLFHFTEFRERWLGLLWLPTSPGLTCSKTQQAHYSLDKQVWTYWTSDPKQPGSTPPLSTLPALFVIWKCLSLSLYRWVSVCLTLVWLGLVSPWSHQSMWGPVKAISPSCSANLCQLCACVSS